MALNKTQSVSVVWRERGNAVYREVREGVAPVLQESRLQQVFAHYEKALSTATNYMDSSSACKNIAMATWKMAKLQLTMGSKEAVVDRYYKESLKHFKNAKECGMERTAEWRDSLVVTALDCWTEMRERIEKKDYEQRCLEMERVVGLIPDDLIQAREYFEIAQTYFSSSVASIVKRDYVGSLRLLSEISFPLQEARRLGVQDEEFVKECDFLDQDVSVQRCVAECLQTYAKGDELLKKIEDEVKISKDGVEQEPNLELAWDTVDLYRRAALLTREHDLELEAMVYSRLGFVYDSVLKMKDRAKICFKKCIELSTTMAPRNFATDEWYKTARNTLERYQQEEIEKEEQRKRAARDLIRADVDKLDKFFKECSHIGFLRFIYQTYPPKNPDHTLKEESNVTDIATITKLYRMASIHYHPDKVQESEHGTRWKLLTEEISKFVNKRYTVYKDLGDAVKSPSYNSEQDESYNSEQDESPA